MSPNPRQYQRRNYYIDKDFQTKFILKFCCLVAFGSAFTVGIVYWLAQHSTTVGIADGRVAVHSTAEYLLPLLLQTVFVELVIVSLATIAMTLMVSHKLAGPLHRVKLMFGKLGEGDFAITMKFRDDDQLQLVAVAYNEATEKLRVQINKAKNASSLDEVKNILNTFKS